MSAIVDANETRKKFIAKQIHSRASKKSKEKPSIGVYRLIMKADSDNFRASAIQDVITHIREMGANIYIYEPTVTEKDFNGFKVMNDFTEFKKKMDIIVANRSSAELADVQNKIYTRDIFSRD